jgi:hypothetical protein
MPLTDAPSFAPAFDVHVLRGQPLSLNRLLQASWTTAAGSASGTFDKYPNQAKDVAIEFRPTFRVDTVGTKFIGAQVEIDNDAGTLTGLLPPQQGAPAPNFIIESVVVRNGPAGAPPPNFPASSKGLLRVHVHQSVEQIWLTPNRLTIRRPKAAGPANTFYRFTVRAQFDDGTVGDITQSGMLTVAPGDADWFWDQQWISIPAAATAGSPVRTVTIQTKPEWNGKSAQGQILVLEPWEPAPDIPQAELIDGPRGIWDGSLKPERVPNILFVPVGITGTDQSTFAQFTATMVHRLRTDRRLNPYPYLADSMNFWHLPIAATEAGVSVRCEVVPFTHQGRLFALPVRAPVRPPDSGTWKLEHLIYAAGLPMPSDQAGSVTIPQLRSRWAGQLRSEWAPKMQDPATVPNGIIEAWQKCAARTFVDEVDNFPAVAIGEPPKIEFDDSGEVLLHPWRGGSDTFPSENAERVALFRRVTAAPRNGVTISIGSGAGAGASIGNLWAADDPSFDFDNRSFVTMFANMGIGRARVGRSQWLGGGPLLMRPTLRLAGEVEIPGLLDLPGVPVERAAGRNALLLDLPQLSATELLPQSWDVFAHELTHAFGLGDEYGDAGVYSFLPLSFPNLMTSDEVLADDHKTVHIDRIKWNWPRVRKACVTTAAVQPLANNLFAVPVAPKQGLRFSPGEPVLLRQRVKRQFMSRFGLTSSECVVSAISADGSTVTISRTAGTLDLRLFGAGSLLYVPVKAPPNLPQHRTYLTMVSPLAERIMAATGGTLGGLTCDPSDESRNGASVQAPHLPSGDFAQSVPRYSLPRLVGVYFGGVQFACGVVHPAGSCKMRSGSDSYSRFCQVCQYALVEQIDPSQHGRIDSDYDSEYTV